MLLNGLRSLRLILKTYRADVQATDARLKQGGQVFGKDYFDNLLEGLQNQDVKIAAELIYSAVDAEKINMGLTT